MEMFSKVDREILKFIFEPVCNAFNMILDAMEMPTHTIKFPNKKTRDQVKCDMKWGK